MPYIPPTDIDPAARALIRHKARRLANGPGFTPADRQDLEQELALHAHIATAGHDPLRGRRSTYFDRVLTRKASDLFRAAVAAKRGRGCGQYVEDLDSLADLAAASAQRLDLQMDVMQALSGLEPTLRRLARSLMWGSKANAARAGQLSRGQVRHGCSKLARHFLPLNPRRHQR